MKKYIFIYILKSFHWIGPLGRFSHRVAMSICLYVCPLWRRHPLALERSSPQVTWPDARPLIGPPLHTAWEGPCGPLRVIRHMSCVMCHMSRVTCHMSRVTCNFFFYHPPQKKYWFYDPHRSRDSVSPVCGIFLQVLKLSRQNRNYTILGPHPPLVGNPAL